MGDLKWVKGSYPTPYGNIVITHKKINDVLEISVIKDDELLIKNELSELLQKKTTFSEIKNLVRSTASMFIFSTTHRSPMVIPVILNRREEIIDE